MEQDQIVFVASSKSCFLYQNDLHLFLVLLLKVMSREHALLSGTIA